MLTGQRRDDRKFASRPECRSGRAGDRKPLAWLLIMAGYDDDDDWVGEPPEGRYSRDRAKPEFWRNRWPLAGAGLIVVVALLVIILITK